MTFLRVLASRIRALFAAPQLDRDLEDELRSHIEMETEANLRRGMTAAEARRKALIEFGGVAQTAEIYREARAVAWVGALLQDIRYALRGFRRAPAFTAVAILSLALGIGVNTTLFSLVNLLILRPLPVKDPGQLVTFSSQQKGSFPMPAFSYPEYRDIRDQTAGALSGVLAYCDGMDGLSVDGRADRVITHYVTGNYFTLLGVKPTLGRVILPSEGKVEGGDPVIVLGYSFWKAHLAGDPNVIGKHVFLNGHAVTVVGVAPKQFHGAQALIDVQGYLPLGMNSISAGFKGFLENRSIRNIYLLGRLAPGVSLNQAQARLKIVSERLSAAYPKDSAGVTVVVQKQLLGRIQSGNELVALGAVFLAMAALVLVLACINLANLLMVRAGARQKEIAMRAALGGSRGRLIRQLLTESFILTCFGALAGLLVSAWTCSALSSLKMQGIPIYLDFTFDGRVLAYALGAAVFAGLMLGIVPALRGSRADLAAVARDGGQRSSASPQRTRSILVIAQVAASFLLLIIASLLNRSLQNGHRLDMGFDARHVLNFSMDPHNVGYNEAQGKQFYKELLQRVRALPEVESASLAISGPISAIPLPMQVQPEGYAPPKGQPAPTIFYDVASPEFFDTLRIPVVRGRPFRASDDQSAPRVAIVSQTFAERFWPGHDPIGKKIQLTVDPMHPIQVVGVLRDARYLAVTEPKQPYIYVPFEQNYAPIQTLRVRYNGATETAIAEVLKEISNLAPGLPVAGVETLLQQIDSSAYGFLGLRIESGFATAMGLLALSLALLGLYGVVSYSAAQRTHEIGVRLTLGASPNDIRKLVLGRGLLIVGIGLPAGLLLSLAAAPIIRGLVQGVSTNDPLTLAGVAVLLASVTLAACYIPARRAVRADPTVALRNE
ncbi:MAG TPA: ABC transporter permease [Bryobacteraceae bacterium]|nr:ABC transporter permease [Bryobacteraceae bacterium]